MKSSQIQRKRYYPSAGGCNANNIIPRIPPPLPQGVDSQYIKYSKEESRFIIDPCLRLGRSEREIANEILEMGWLFMTVMDYIENVDSEKRLDF